MSNLRQVKFFDTDTVMWSNNGRYSPIASQYVIALYDEGFTLLDTVSRSAMDVRNTM